MTVTTEPAPPSAAPGDPALSVDIVRELACAAAQNAVREAVADAARDAAEQAAHTAVRDVLERLGFDTTDTRATRQDADWLRDARLRSADPEYQRDRMFLRNQRLAHEQIMPIFRRTAIGLVLGAAATATWLGLREMLST
ncbi:hypothetical protein [Fodinicurvata sp. EGI_FJ10296]|uniref:hypothetical protein n=1 Tax=Fodinicurvata sp. EGI_FJ10296 TaxID=3231908 RepID=UPI003453D066